MRPRCWNGTIGTPLWGIRTIRCWSWIEVWPRFTIVMLDLDAVGMLALHYAFHAGVLASYTGTTADYEAVLADRTARVDACIAELEQTQRDGGDILAVLRRYVA